jgi:phosphate transport system substrate-binding protein
MLKKLAVAFAATLLAGASVASAAGLTGAGATFPAPVYTKWAETYRAQTGVAVNYQAIGSGGGIKQIKAKTVDFGASDKPLKLEELNAAGLYQFPTVVGGVVPVFNVGGLQPGQLHLSGAVLADIYRGVITKWNAPQIAALNPGIRMPPLPITVVHRADGSGTSFIFTSYLSAKSPLWAKQVGASDSVQWPVGLGGKGNDGVSAFVKQTKGSIGYVEYAYAKQNHLNYASLQNRSGAWVMPQAANFAAAAANANWPAARGNYLLLIDQPGARAWPISGATFILVYKNQGDQATCKSVLKFFDWAYAKGDAAAVQLDYVPLPAAVKAMMRKQWTANVRGPAGSCYP